MNGNEKVQSMWMGPSLSPMEQMCIRSYLKNGHAFHLYVYEPVENVPEGTTVMDANTILPRNEVYVDVFGGYISLSNQFRYALLYRKGGWWVDMDTVCLKPFDFGADYVFSSETDETNNRILVNTTFVKSLAGSRFLGDCLDFIRARGSRNIHWGELGVNLISRMIFRNRLEQYIMPPASFCPISYQRLELLMGSPPDYSLTDRSYALHWWNEVWRRRSLDKHGRFPQDCLYEKMKNRYLHN